MIEVDVMIQFSMTYVINVSEGRKLCPLEARLNPEWRCKEWDETKTDTYTFFG